MSARDGVRRCFIVGCHRPAHPDADECAEHLAEVECFCTGPYDDQWLDSFGPDSQPEYPDSRLDLAHLTGDPGCKYTPKEYRDD